MRIQLRISQAELLVNGEAVKTVAINRLYTVTENLFEELGIGDSDAQVGGEARLFAATTAPVSEDAITDASQVTQGQRVFLDGLTFRGEGYVEKTKPAKRGTGTDVIIRLTEDENSGRSNVRVRVLQEDLAAGRLTHAQAPTEAPSVEGDESQADVSQADVIGSADDVRPGQRVRLNGRTFRGVGHVEKTKRARSGSGRDVIIRLHRDENSGRSNVRVRVFSSDLQAGMLTSAA